MSLANHRNDRLRLLLSSALDLYVAHTQKELARKRSWIREPNNFISVVAICLSVFGVTWGFYKDWRDGLNSDLQSFSTVVSDITKLQSDLAMAGVNQNLPELGRIIANRRLVLLAEADRLTDQLGDRAPRVQLAVLGDAFFQTLQYEKAIKYFTHTTDPKAPVLVQQAGWRSIALVYQAQGPAKYDLARQAFAAAAKTMPDPQETPSIGMLAEVYRAWIGLELAAQRPAEALDLIRLVLQLTTRMPCDSYRKSLAKRFVDLAQPIVPPPGAVLSAFDAAKEGGFASCPPQ